VSLTVDIDEEAVVANQEHGELLAAACRSPERREYRCSRSSLSEASTGTDAAAGHWW
jgi:hypothetical protein